MENIKVLKPFFAIQIWEGSTIHTNKYTKKMLCCDEPVTWKNMFRKLQC